MGTAYLVIRTIGDPLPLAPAVVNIARDLDPSLPVPTVRTLEDELTESIADRRLRVIPAVGFAALALAVALVGLFSTVGRAVTERRHELAIRAAVGASQERLVGLIVTSGVRMTVIGVTLGLAGSAWAAAGLAHLLYGVTPYDPLAFLGATLLVVIVSLAAAYLPARRAASLDPMAALRAE